MVDLTDEQKQRFFEDSVNKFLRIAIYEYDNASKNYKPLHVIDENEIILESARYEEGLMDGYTFELGSFVLPQLNIEWLFSGTRYQGKKCFVYQVIDNQALVYFGGIIDTEKLSRDMAVVSATIRPTMYYSLNFNMVRYYDNLMSSGLPNKSMLDMVKKIYVDYLQEKTLGGIIIPDVIEKSFPNIKNLLFSHKLNVDTMPYGEFLKYLGDSLGTGFILEKKLYDLSVLSLPQDSSSFTNIIKAVRFDGNTPNNPSALLNPSFEIPYYIDMSFDEKVDLGYDAVEITYLGKENRIKKYVYPYVFNQEYKNIYRIDATRFGNAFGDSFSGLENGNTSNEFLKNFSTSVAAYLSSLKYNCAILDGVYLPFLEGGDNIIATTKDGKKVIIPILSCNSQGISAARCTISSNIRTN